MNRLKRLAVENGVAASHAAASSFRKGYANAMRRMNRAQMSQDEEQLNKIQNRGGNWVEGSGTNTTCMRRTTRGLWRWSTHERRRWNSGEAGPTGGKGKGRSGQRSRGRRAQGEEPVGGPDPCTEWGIRRVSKGKVEDFGVHRRSDPLFPWSPQETQLYHNSVNQESYNDSLYIIIKQSS